MSTLASALSTAGLNVTILRDLNNTESWSLKSRTSQRNSWPASSNTFIAQFHPKKITKPKHMFFGKWNFIGFRIPWPEAKLDDIVNEEMARMEKQSSVETSLGPIWRKALGATMPRQIFSVGWLTEFVSYCKRDATSQHFLQGKISHVTGTNVCKVAWWGTLVCSSLLQQSDVCSSHHAVEGRNLEEHILMGVFEHLLFVDDLDERCVKTAGRSLNSQPL